MEIYKYDNMTSRDQLKTIFEKFLPVFALGLDELRVRTYTGGFSHRLDKSRQEVMNDKKSLIRSIEPRVNATEKTLAAILEAYDSPLVNGLPHIATVVQALGLIKNDFRGKRVNLNPDVSRKDGNTDNRVPVGEWPHRFVKAYNIPATKSEESGTSIPESAIK